MDMVTKTVPCIEWVKFGTIHKLHVLSSDGILVSGGSWLMVVETGPQHKVFIHHCESGVQVAAAHHSLPCIAYADKKKDPRIFILLYPSFKEIRNLPEISAGNVEQLDFSDLDLLVGVARSVFGTNIYFWNWRNAELLSIVKSAFEEPHQSIRVSASCPTRVSEWDDHRLYIWQPHQCYKHCFISKQVVEFSSRLKPPVTCNWNNESQLFLLDSAASLFSINLENGWQQHEVDVVEENESGPTESSFCFAFLGAGIIVYFNGQISFLRKKQEGWCNVWTLETAKIADLVCMMTHSGGDQIYCLTLKNELMAVNADKNAELSPIRQFGTQADFLCFVQPEGQHFITFSNKTQTLVVWETATGQTVDQHHLEVADEALVLVAAINTPIIAMGFRNGLITIFHIQSGTQKMVLPTRDTIECIKFISTYSGFCAASLKTGQFFVVEGSNFNIIAALQIHKSACDFLFTSNGGDMKMLILTSADPLSNLAGNVICVFKLDGNKANFVAINEVKLGHSYRSIDNLSSGVIAVPFNSTKIHQLGSNFEVTKEIETGHLLGNYKIRSNENYIFTFGEDGIVSCFAKQNGEIADIVFSLKTFHYADGGVINLDCDPGASTFIVTGKNSNFVCYSTGLPRFKKYAPVIPPFQEEPTEEVHSETWLERQERKKVDEIQGKYRNIKEGLQQRLDAVKSEIKRLLDENEVCPDDERLDISEFELDETEKRRIEEAEGLARIEAHEMILAKMKAQDEESERIIQSTWQKMATQSKELKPLSEVCDCPVVRSYGLMKRSTESKPEWVQEKLNLVAHFQYGDFFQPWIPTTESALKSQIKEASEVTLLKRRESLVLDPKDLPMHHFPFVSTSAHDFLPNRTLPHSLLQVNTTFYAKEIISTTEGVIESLMKHFNEKFNAVSEEKKIELKTLKERRMRLRQVSAELQQMDYPCQLSAEDLQGPCWSPSELPETFLTVADHELEAPPYRRPEEIAEERRLAEAEKTRQELLIADDFLERALDAMMDGVLEKRWEDEIKKLIPKPEFMIIKEASHWTDEEVRKANMYADTIAKLQAERDRYKNLLMAEFMQLKASIKESELNFNEKLSKLHEMKLRVESAVGEEELNILRLRQEMLRKTQMEENEEKIRMAIGKEERRLLGLMEDGGKLQDVISEGRAAHEILLARDKNLDKNFKKDFTELSAVICDQLHKLSKKRPKLTGRASNNAAVLNELGRCAILNKDKSCRIPLPSEAAEFLKGIDALDAPINIPAAVNETSWDNLCRFRRIKIDSELKIRALAIDISETEQTAIFWQKQIKNCKDGILRKQAELEELLYEKRMLELDCPVQMVVPQRVLEVETTGQISDFKDASLIAKSIVDQVNLEIKRVGQQKIHALQKSSELRKTIMSREWEHRMLFLQVDDLKAQLETLQQFHVTKESQYILNAREKGNYDEKGFAHLEREMRAVRLRFERKEIALQQTIEDQEQKTKTLEKENEKMDEQIAALDKELIQKSKLRDLDAEEEEAKQAKLRMQNIMRRGKLVARSQELENEISALLAERETLRLKVHPTIVHKN